MRARLVLCEGAGQPAGTNPKDMRVDSVSIDGKGRARCQFCWKRVRVKEDGTLWYHKRASGDFVM